MILDYNFNIWTFFHVPAYRQIIWYWITILTFGVFFTVMWSSYCQWPLSMLPLRHRSVFINETQMLKIPEDLGFSEYEWDQIQRALHWGEPDHQITNATMSTSPDHSTFLINNFKDSYYVGEELHATIFARDFTGMPKHYGGDFFQAKVYSDTLKASVFGEVLDHQNGTYSARFTLPWVGKALVAIRLIHSSEGVQVLKRIRDSSYIYYLGFFVGKNPQGARVEEKAICNIKWEGLVLPGEGERCEYKDARTGATWHCRKPQTLPCDALLYHNTDELMRDITTALDRVFMSRQHVDHWLKGDSRQIRVIVSNSTIGTIKSCKPGMPTPTPAGFYMNNIWTSFVCAARHFGDVNDRTQCLKDKQIYTMGDSTLRQWFEFLCGAVPTLKRMNLYSDRQVGPFMAVDVENNILLHHRSHGAPRCCPDGPIAAMHYISNQIDDLAGGPHTVIVLNVLAHFTQFPVSFYAHRVYQIRRAVVALLKRAPQTKVIIKTANTGYKDLNRSDWLAMQLDQILREVFRDVGVYILDVWQMTACHYNADDLHPAQVIVQNEIDILLSFICPN
ncbi:NXPE family member 3-like isoform X4 [Alosa pseudoharengus]|uniref:NXPE family member 3-like isoform X4 n=1 Tax=Alosa pseudoharengus TaxID=34774 RepID=UPI003F8BF698